MSFLCPVKFPSCDLGFRNESDYKCFDLHGHITPTGLDKTHPKQVKCGRGVLGGGLGGTPARKEHCVVPAALIWQAQPSEST